MTQMKLDQTLFSNKVHFQVNVTLPILHLRTPSLYCHYKYVSTYVSYSCLSIPKTNNKTMVVAQFSGGAGGVKLREMWGFGLHVITGRWFMVFASLLIMSVAGATYMFGLYSGDIKSSLGYDQTTLNLLSSFKDLGGNIGIVSGLINEVAPPWVVLFIGAIMNFTGYFMIWLSVTGKIAKPHVWQMCLYICIGANSQTYANTGALVTCVKNFPESRGVVLGLLKGFVGLSGAIITQIYHSLYGQEHRKELILLIAWLPALVSIAFLRTVRIMKVVRHVNELNVFYNLLYISLGLAGFLMTIIVLQNKFNFSKVEFVGSASVVVVLLFAPLSIVFQEELKVWKNKKRVLNDSSQFKVVTQVTASAESVVPPPPPQVAAPPHGEENFGISKSSDESIQEKNVSCWRSVFRPPARGEDYTILQALFSIDMVILFTTTTFGVGGTLTAIDNLGQIGKSLGYPQKSISTFVSLVSIWNYLGRVVSGVLSEIVLSKYKFPRPLMLTIVLLISCVGHLLIAFGVPNSLYLSSIIMGFSFGAQWPLIFAIISELFGLKYYSTLYNLGAGASPVGAYILNVLVAGHLYDKEATKQNIAKGIARKVGEDLSCTGVECYKLSFLIITVGTVCASAVSLILVVRTRKFYRGDIYKKFREAAEANTDAEMAVVTETVVAPPPCQAERQATVHGEMIN